MDPAVAQRRFGLAIRGQREAAGLSQEDLGFQADVHRTYVSMIERGGGNPSLTVIVRLTNALGSTLTSLMREVERS